MTIHNRKAVVARDGRSIIVLGKDNREWRLYPGTFCTWALRDPRKREVAGFGVTVWQAMKDAEKIKKGEKK
jgi:hypothetical protein